MRNLLLAAAALLLSISASAQQWTKLEGQHSGIKERRLVAVSDKAAWETMWKEHNASSPVPAVDFSKETVVAVFLGETQNAGVKVEVVVQDDAIDSNRLNVFYKEVRPASKPFAAIVICQPYAIVKVRKATVAFESNGTMSIPEKGKAPANPRDTTKVRALLETLSAPSFDGVR